MLHASLDPPRPLTHYRMEWANLLKTSCILGGLGFATALLCSVLLGYSVQYSFIAFLWGMIDSGFTVINIIIAIAMRADWRERYFVAFTAIVAAVGGVLLILLPNDFHIRASYIDRAAVYIFIAMPPAFLLAPGWLIIMHCLVPAIVKQAALENYQELALYMMCAFVCAISLGVVFPIAPGNTVREIRENGLMLSISVWFFTGVLAAVIGILIERKSDKRGVAEYNMTQATSRPSQTVTSVPALVPETDGKT
jgi:hypothetical protein